MKYVVLLAVALITVSFIFSTVLAVAWKISGMIVAALVLFLGYYVLKRKLTKKKARF